ncbi:MAG: hypothetical protein RLZZ628_907 [Bacteroidota bacterium]
MSAKDFCPIIRGRNYIIPVKISNFVLNINLFGLRTRIIRENSGQNQIKKVFLQQAQPNPNCA